MLDDCKCTLHRYTYLCVRFDKKFSKDDNDRIFFSLQCFNAKKSFNVGDSNIDRKLNQMNFDKVSHLLQSFSIFLKFCRFIERSEAKRRKKKKKQKKDEKENRNTHVQLCRGTTNSLNTFLLIPLHQ